MTIEERLSKLERVNRTWRRVSISLAVVLGVSITCSERAVDRSGHGHVGAAMAADGEKVYDKVRLKRLEIVSAEGRTVGLLNGDNGDGTILLFPASADGSGIALLATDAGGSLTLMANKKQEVSIGSLKSEGGGGYVAVFNAAGKTSATLSTARNQCGLVTVHGVNGEIVRALSGGR